ncbi:MAG: ATP-binding protein [Bacteroidota bacterium]
MLSKRFFLLGLLILISPLIFASRIDSLRSAERLSSDPSVRFELNLLLIEAFLDTDLDSTAKYINRGKQTGLANTTAQNSSRILFLESKYLVIQGLMDSAEVVARQAQDFALIAADSNLLAQNHFVLGYIYVNVGKNDSAKVNLDRAIQFLGPQSPNASPQKALIRLKTLVTYGFYYQNQGNFPLALRNYIDAEQISNSFDLPPNNTESTLPNNIALIYLDQENYELALKYFQKSLAMAQKGTVTEGTLSLIKGNIGVVYNRMGEYEKANPLLKASLRAYTQSDHRLGRILMLNEFARQYQAQKNWAKSDSFLLETLPLMANVNPNRFFLESLIMLGQNARNQNRLIEAAKYADQAYPLSKELKNLRALVLVTELKKDLSFQRGDYRNAFLYQEEHLSYSDSLINEQNIRQLEAINFNNTIAQQALENESLKQQQLIQSKVIKQQQLIIGLIIFGLLLSLYFIYKRVQLHREQKKISARLKIRTEALQIAKAEAEEATRSKAEFLSIMSHEIRTPMNAVIGMTHLLLDENPRPSQVEYLKNLQFSGNNLLSLINDILDFSKISAGKMELEHITFNLYKLTKGIVQAVGIRAQDKGIEIHHEYGSDLQEYYSGDPVRIGQVLSNLLGNAIKFTEKGSVSLRLSRGPKKSICFEIIDTGIGIPREKQAQIFEQFAQSSTEIARKYGGTGLGLAISKNLLELMGSNIRLKSTEGMGSTFYFFLALEEAEIKRSTKADLSLSPIEKLGTLKGTKVLLAEDNRINQIVCSRFLQKWDIEFEVAKDGEEAIALLEKHKFDLILMDIQMPKMNGIEATKAIRGATDKSYHQIPIVALTASILDESMESVQEVGMNDLIGKPFDPTLLYQKISQHAQLES